jgi:hypothetical protein
MTAESAVERKLKAAIKAVGGRCIKLPAIWYGGIPDRLVLLPGGRVWFVELKRVGGRTTKQVKARQSAWAKFLSNSGFNYARLDGMAEVEEFIHDHVRPAL